MKRTLILSLIAIFLAGLVSCSGQLESEIYEPDVEGGARKTFTMYTYFNTYIDEEINAQLFEEIIYSNPVEWDFMVLVPDNPIQGSTFMQVGAPRGDSLFCIEIGFGDMETTLRLYLLRTDKNVVLHYIIAYWQEQNIPDISSWKDISDRLIPVDHVRVSPMNTVIAYLEGLRDSDLTRMAKALPDQDFLGDEIFVEEVIHNFIDHLNFLIEEFQIPVNPGEFESLSILGLIPPRAIDERYLSERHQDNLLNMAERLGVQQLVHCIVIFELGGEKHMLVVDVVDFGGNWRILQFGGPLSAMLRIDPHLKGFVPSAILSEFLGELELEAVMVPIH